MSFLFLNKPSGWTSLDVVAKLRGILHEERIGHAGTLDPFATGLLIVGVGRESTKRLDEFKGLEKEYVVTMRFGATSDTYDCDGVIIENTHKKIITHDEVIEALQKYHGEIEQIPPMYSAKKVGGKKLYKLARQGIVVERKPQIVTISELEIIQYAENILQLRVVCSPGTYIRSLVHAIGADLAVGAYATELVRTRIGTYTLHNAQTLEEIIAQKYT